MILKKKHIMADNIRTNNISFENIFLIPWTFLTEIYKTKIKNKNVTIKLSVYILNNLIFFYFI